MQTMQHQAKEKAILIICVAGFLVSGAAGIILLLLTSPTGTRTLALWLGCGWTVLLAAVAWLAIFALLAAPLSALPKANMVARTTPALAWMHVSYAAVSYFLLIAQLWSTPSPLLARILLIAQVLLAAAVAVVTLLVPVSLLHSGSHKPTDHSNGV
jgi:hypothetical protein